MHTSGNDHHDLCSDCPHVRQLQSREPQSRVLVVLPSYASHVRRSSVRAQATSHTSLFMTLDSETIRTKTQSLQASAKSATTYSFAATRG